MVRSLIAISVLVACSEPAVVPEDEPPGCTESPCELTEREQALLRRVAFNHLLAQMQVDQIQSIPRTAWEAIYPFMYFPDLQGELHETYAPLEVGSASVPPCGHGIVPGFGRSANEWPSVASCRRFSHPDASSLRVEIALTFGEAFPYAIENLQDVEGYLSDDEWLGQAMYRAYAYAADIKRTSDAEHTVASEMRSQFSYQGPDDVALLETNVVSTLRSTIDTSAGLLDFVELDHELRYAGLLEDREVVLSSHIDRDGHLVGTVMVGDESIGALRGSFAEGTIRDRFDSFVFDWQD